MKVGTAVIVGRGISAALAAIALQRAFARGGLKVHWVEMPPVVSSHDLFAPLPNIQSFHQLLGIGESELLRATQGSFSLGQQYAGFAGEGSSFLHSYGPTGRPVGSLPFLQFWSKARAAGLPAGFTDFARDAVAAQNGRMQLPEEQRPPPTAHGYHFNAAAYAALLRTHAEKLGVVIHRDGAPQPIVTDGRVIAVRLADGSEVAGDLFIDATGHNAMILSAIDAAKSTDIAISNCNNIMVADGEALNPIPLYGRMTAHRGGWSAIYPMQAKTGIVVAYDGAIIDDEEAVKLAGIPVTSSPEFHALVPQYRPRPWVGNVVAIGDAAVVPEPIAATRLHRMQIAITHLIALFPVRADVMLESEIYNEEIGAYHARLNDFQAAHYALNQRGDPFWQAARGRPISPELRAKIDLFEARGMIAQYNHESFAEEEWMTAFIGHGLMPRSYDPQVDRVSEQQVMADFQAQLAGIKSEVMAMDTHAAALAKAMRA